MKKPFYYITILLLALPFLSRSQMMLGPKVGMNIAGQTGVEFTVPKLDYAFGAALQVQITDLLKIQGEFIYSRKGYREEVIANGNEVLDELTATYLEVPAMLKFTKMGVNWGFYGSAGVYWSYWIKKEYEEGQLRPYEIAFVNSFDPKDTSPYRDIRSDFGGVVEAGVTYDNFSSGVLALGLRYSHGLVATGEYQVNPPANFNGNKNRVFTISLTYFLFL